MKTLFIIFLTFLVVSSTNFSQKKNTFIAEVKNNEVTIKLHRIIEVKDSDSKKGFKYLVTDITIENISDKNITVGAEYTMNITLIDDAGIKYRSGLKGTGIVSTYLTKAGSEEQDQKAFNLCFSDKFPPKTKARSFLCGFEVPTGANIVSFGIKDKNLWNSIKK
jgi:hypothetical protein